MLRNILFVALGGAIGSVLRFLLSKWLQGSVVTAFPVGTLAVNLLGCLMIGVFYGLFDRGALLDANLKLFLTVGLCGGFTTFSTFCNESLHLFRSDNILYGALYAGGSVFFGLIAVFLGVHLAKLV
jgi:CrcB protein